MSIIRKELGRVTGQLDIVPITVSFDSGEQGANPIVFPFPVLITSVSAYVNKPLGATDSGTISVTSPSGSLGTLTGAASAAFGTSIGTLTPTTFNTIAVGQALTLTTAKTTAGGKAQVFITFKRI